VLVLGGRALAAEDQRVLSAFAAQVAVAFEQRRLTEAAHAAAGVAEADRMRTTLLNAVSHDLRTPIASAKAAISSLRSGEVRWSPEDRQELLATADDALDRLTDLVTNLLDLSRLQAGVLSVAIRPVGVDEVVGVALDHVRGAVPDRRAQSVEVDVPATLPEVAADPGLFERVVANLVENALRHGPADQPVRLAASTIGDVVELRVIDRGPGIPADDRARVFAPFQRRDDHGVSDGMGVGLGLAIARGFVEAMRGTVTLDDTPGGGLTVTVGLPTAS
jgi:two-component system sensor histidine kinase KdpD